MAKLIIRFEDIESQGPEFEACIKLHDAIKTMSRVNVAGVTVMPVGFESEGSTTDPESYTGEISGVRGARPSYITINFECLVVRD